MGNNISKNFEQSHVCVGQALALQVNFANIPWGQRMEVILGTAEYVKKYTCHTQGYYRMCIMKCVCSYYSEITLLWKTAGQQLLSAVDLTKKSSCEYTIPPINKIWCTMASFTATWCFFSNITCPHCYYWTSNKLPELLQTENAHFLRQVTPLTEPGHTQNESGISTFHVDYVLQITHTDQPSNQATYSQ